MEIKIERKETVWERKRLHRVNSRLWKFCGLAWNALRCLLWVNPFLTVCQKQFRADMEDISDRVCIQGSGRTTHEYDSEGNAGILDYGSSIHQMISYDASYVYVDREA